MTAAQVTSRANRFEPPTLTATPTEYRDLRKDCSPHKAIDLTVSNAAQLTGRELLTNILGIADADILIGDMEEVKNLDKKLPASFTVALFLDSNNKARNRGSAPDSAITTQEEDFEGAGLSFAKKVKSAVVCALVVRKARDVGVEKLSLEEKHVLTNLKSGFIRVDDSGALYISVDGGLRALNFYDVVHANGVAFGGRPAAE